MKFIKLTPEGHSDSDERILINADYIVALQIDSAYRTQLTVAHRGYLYVEESVSDIIDMMNATVGE